METGQTEMGRKPIVPYGLYRTHGFYNPLLASSDGGTGVSSEDLETFWEAMKHLFDLDRSAARGEMIVRGLYIFSHENPLGNAPAHKLFERIQINLKDEAKPPRLFSDYAVTVDDLDLPAGVALTPLVTD